MRIHDEFLADVAAIYIGDPKGSFGSGRLIAPNLILTAGHVVDYPTREDPKRIGWVVVLIRDRDKDGRWSHAHEATVIWRGSGDLDLALLQLIDKKLLEPNLRTEFASYKLVGPVGEIIAAGFPEAWASDAEPTRDYSVSGGLRIASQRGPYAWTVLDADKPDEPQGWKGMSGSAVCRFGADDRLYLFGAVQQIPTNFSSGFLEVARISDAFADAQFCSFLQAALGTAPVLQVFDPTQSPAVLERIRFIEQKVRSFVNEYLVSDKGPVPFGGRDTELRRLDKWLFDPQSAPRMIVTSPAGRGKSALIVRWIKNLQDGGLCGVDGWQLAFVPISARADTSLPENFYRLLSNQLANIIGEPFLPDVAPGRVRDQLVRIAADTTKRVLIVMDGLDEALRESFDPDVLPMPMPKNLRVALSARWQLGDHNSDGWLERLRWNVGTKVETLELEPLDSVGVEEVLFKLGAPVSALAHDPILVKQLAELTEGEPLLLRFYAEDFRTSMAKGARITAADLINLKPGFDSYFEFLFQRQQQIWEGAGLKDQDTQPYYVILSILSFALGPMSGPDILALIERIYGTKGVTSVDILLEPWRRFVYGSGEPDVGYVLIHPKIGDYFQKKLFTAIDVKMRNAFAEWARAHATDLNTGKTQPKDGSYYCLKHLPDHLKDKKVQASPDDFMVMVQNGWRLAWEKFEGGQAGFASAIEAAFARQRKDKANPRLGARWRCALTLSSIHSLGVNIPAKLLLAAAEKEVLTIRQAAHYAELIGYSTDKVQVLAGLAAAVRHNQPLSSDLISSAFASAKAIADPEERARAVATLLPQLTPEQKEQGVLEAQDAVRVIENDTFRVLAIAALAAEIPQSQRNQALNQMLREALTVVGTIEIEENRSTALVKLAHCLPPEWLPEALAVAQRMEHEVQRATSLAGLGLRLTGELLRDALKTAKLMKRNYCRAIALAGLVPGLPPDERLGALTETLESAERIAENYWRSVAVIEFVRHLPAELSRLKDRALLVALDAAKAIEKYDVRLWFMAELAPYMTIEQKREELYNCIQLISGIRREMERSAALSRLAEHLPEEFLGDAASMAKNIDHPYYRSQALASLARRLPAEVVKEALRAVKAIYDRRERASALAALAKYLPIRMRQRALSDALAAAKSIGYEVRRAEALTALSLNLPLREKKVAIREAFAAAVSCVEEHERAHAIASLAPLLPAKLMADAVSATAAIRGEMYRGKALEALVSYLPAELTDAGLAATKTIHNGGYRSNVLVALAPRLPARLLGEAVLSARLIDDLYHRATALTALARRVSVGKRRAMLDEALADANAVENSIFRSKALIGLASYLPRNRKAEAISAAVSAARDIGSEYYRSISLGEASLRVPKDQKLFLLEEALACANSIEDDLYYKMALSELGPHLPVQLADRAIDEANSRIHEDERGAMALIALAPTLPLDLIPKALFVAKSINDAWSKSKAMSILAVRLPSKDRLSALEETMHVIEAVEDEQERSEFLFAIVMSLPHRLHCQAMNVAKSFKSEHWRVDALAKLVAADVVDIVEDKRAILVEIIDLTSDVSRDVALLTITTIARLNFELGGQPLIQDLHLILCDNCSWYP
jgi:hypothetical protein